MIRLDATTRKLQAVLSGIITTNQLPVSLSYSDKTSSAYAGAMQLTNTNSTTAVDICAAPSASTVRDVDYISVRNSDTVAATVTIRYNDNATLYSLITATLAVGDQLVYTHGNGWHTVDSTGQTKATSATLSLTASNITNVAAGGIAATNVQTALNELDTEKAPIASPTFTGTVVLPSATSIATVSATEISHLGGVTSAIQTQIDTKAPIASPTFTGTVVTDLVQVYAANKTNAAETGSLTLRSTDAFAIDKGGSIALWGKYNAGGDYAAFARIYGAKENATDGNFVGYFAIATGGGGAPVERLRVSSTGVITGTATTASTSKTTGALVVSGGLGVAKEVSAASLRLDYTNTATVGAVTIDKASGRVRIAAAGTSVVVTNSLVTAASHVFVVASTNDATARVTSVVPAAGSFTVYTAAVTAETTFDFLVVNAD